MVKDEFKRIIARIELAWNVTFDDAKKEIYAEGMSDLPYDKTLLAVKKLIQTNEFVPKIATIRNAVYSIENEPMGVLGAVHLITKNIREHGSYGSVKAMKNIHEEDPIAYAIVKTLGFTEVCRSSADFFVPRFEKLYREAVETKRRDGVVSDRVLRQIEGFREALFAKNVQLIESENAESGRI